MLKGERQSERIESEYVVDFEIYLLELITLVMKVIITLVLKGNRRGIESEYLVD